MLSHFVYVTNFLADRLRRDDRGATAVEYGLIVALIAAVIVGVLITLGQQVNAAFQAVATAIQNAL
jgi:pilus assembly protein Flp/PilA